MVRHHQRGLKGEERGSGRDPSSPLAGILLGPSCFGLWEIETAMQVVGIACCTGACRGGGPSCRPSTARTRAPTSSELGERRRSPSSVPLVGAQAPVRGATPAQFDLKGEACASSRRSDPSSSALAGCFGWWEIETNAPGLRLSARLGGSRLGAAAMRGRGVAVARVLDERRWLQGAARGRAAAVCFVTHVCSYSRY